MAKSSELFIVDNTDNDWKVVRYLRDFCEISEKIDIATGFFEIGSFLALDGEWQKVDKIRILMGDEVSDRTARVIRESLEKVCSRLDESLEGEKFRDDFLTGVPAIVRALREGKIECRVFKKDKFHAKAYITHSRVEVVGSTALVGSSNFTRPGIQENVELNVQIRGAEVRLLQDWYESHWEKAEDCTPDIIKVIERHSRDYLPYDVWLKSISEYLRGHEVSADEWVRNESDIYPMLAKYQKDGYQALMKRAKKYGGAFLCDGVGLGKTFIGLMLIERFLMYRENRKNVALFVPKSAREAVWEAELDKHLPGARLGFLPFKIFNHTDLHREKMRDEFEQVKEHTDVIIIDEAHHFRNRGNRGTRNPKKRSRYYKMLELTENKQVFLLTATPINNRIADFKNLVDLFAQEDSRYFYETLRINSLDGHFRRLDKQLDELTEEVKKEEAVTDRELDFELVSDVMGEDPLFKELVVQRSRKYVKESVTIEDDDELLFPDRTPPQVAEYDIKKAYSGLLKKIEDGFSKEKPLFVLSIYDPYMHYKGVLEDEDPLLVYRSKQVVQLIRINFLKLFESSAEAFKGSSRVLLYKLLAWIEVHSQKKSDKDRLDRWRRRHSDIIEYVKSEQGPQKDMFLGREDELEEDVIPPEFLDRMADEKLDPKKFDVPSILNDAYEDLDQVLEFFKETQKVTPERDDKLQKLMNLLRDDEVLSKHKVIIFTEFKATAEYLANQLKRNEFEGVQLIDSTTSENRAELIRRFSPYYNNSSSAELADSNKEEIRILVSTDVLAEGLNLQDCTRLINYDIHWNPVRLMQRIGRIDRRLDPQIEKRIIADHPETESIRRTAAYWNFIPPDDLEILLRLHKRVAHKTLRISKVLGIEGGKLLKPDDDYDDLKNFDEQYEGKKSFEEELRLERDKLLHDHPELEQQIQNYPGRLFSGRESPEIGTKGVFFCYALPVPRKLEKDEEVDGPAERWSTELGSTKWYYIDSNSGEITDDARRIATLIRSEPDTPRVCKRDQAQLVELRKSIEKEIKNSYLKKMDAPMGVKPELRCWMEIN